MTMLEVVDDPDAGIVVRKIPTNAADERRLRHEHEMLQASQHPGVLELVGADREHGLVTRYVGPESLETAPVTDAAEAARVVATLADTVADLHALGIVHGRVEPSHVVLDQAGNPILSGFGGSTYVGTVAPPSAPMPPELTDPAHDRTEPVDPSLDVFGLGAVLDLLLTESDTGTDPVSFADRWLSPEAIRRAWRGRHRRTLLTIASHAMAPDATARPTARELAQSLRDAAAKLDAAVRTTESSDPPRAPARRGAVAAAVVGLALLAFGASSLLGRAAPSAPSELAPLDVALPASSGAVRAPCPEVVGVPAVDIGGDGCVDGALVADDGTVAVGRAHFAIGTAGDRVVIGDWNCDGVATPAMLRVATGAVYEFQSWAGPGDDVEAELIGTAPGAVGLRPSTDACPHVEAVAADGSVVAVA